MNNEVIYCFSMIKDEQRYLDNWIEHNLKIGFDKIILYEDYCSSRHDVSKWKEKVVLLKMPDCFNDDEMRLMKEGVYRQHSVYDHFNRVYRDECDWFMFTDVDEFLEAQNVKRMIGKYIYDIFDIHQICFRYRIYGHSGHLKDPYPGESYSVRDTYTKECTDYKSIAALGNPFKSLVCSQEDDIPRFSKDCYNIPHMPVDPAEGDCTLIAFEKLAHYWTYSLEEYLWRLCEQGLISEESWNRTIEDFFTVNKIEMDEEAEKIIEEVTSRHAVKYNNFDIFE